MKKLVQSLPQADSAANLYVQSLLPDYNDNNYFDAQLTKAAKAKNWTCWFFQDWNWHEYDPDIATAVDAVPDAEATEGSEQPCFNLQGQRVGKDYRGIVIVNGRKIRNKSTDFVHFFIPYKVGSIHLHG